MTIEEEDIKEKLDLLDNKLSSNDYSKYLSDNGQLVSTTKKELTMRLDQLAYEKVDKECSIKHYESIRQWIIAKLGKVPTNKDMQLEGVEFYKWFIKDKLDTKAISHSTGLDEGLVGAIKYFNKPSSDITIAGNLDIMGISSNANTAHQLVNNCSHNCSNCYTNPERLT
jgi:hypothetical protein